jgi:acyl transferase domain-containing protein
VGGANLHFAAEQFLAFDNQQLLSSSGQSFSFDHRASGYGRGEGFGVLVIKRVPDALRDGDNIRAIIRGTGAGQDGRTPSITTPSQVAQEALIRDTYLRAQLDPKDTSYVEAHGTGTAQGDPTEARALGRVFGNDRPKGQPLIM